MKSQKVAYPYFRQLLTKKTKPKVFFLHIPKCGGVSLNQAIRNSYGNRAKQAEYCFSLDGNAARKCSQLLEDERNEYRKKILAYVMTSDRYRYIHGHFAYSEKIFQEFGSEWNFITLLRHPVAQWFSQYFYDRRQDSEVRIDAELTAFIESERAILMGNTYVRKLTEGFSATEASSDKAIKKAIENLNQFALVGVLEKLDTLVEDYQNSFATSLFIKKLNQNPTKKVEQQQKITPEITKKVEEICQPNLKVYQSVINKL